MSRIEGIRMVFGKLMYTQIYIFLFLFLSVVEDRENCMQFLK